MQGGTSDRQIFRVLLRMQIAAGSGPEFERAWVDVAGVIAEQPANLGQWLMRAVDEDDVYYVISDWVDEDAFREFERSPEHLSHRGRIDQFRRGGWMTTTHLVRRVPATGPRAALTP